MFRRPERFMDAMNPLNPNVTDTVAEAVEMLRPTSEVRRPLIYKSESFPWIILM